MNFREDNIIDLIIANNRDISSLQKIQLETSGRDRKYVKTAITILKHHAHKLEALRAEVNKIEKEVFMDNLKRCAAEVRTWPKWKREIFDKAPRSEGGDE